MTRPTKETYDLILDLRNALAAAMRVIAGISHADTQGDFLGTRIDAFLEEARQAGIKDGIGVRANE